MCIKYVVIVVGGGWPTTANCILLLSLPINDESRRESNAPPVLDILCKKVRLG